MKTGIFSLPDHRMTFMEAVDYAVSLGMDAIEPYPGSEFASPDTDAARRLADYAASCGIGICCFSMGADVVTGAVQESIASIRRYIDVAAAMGSPYFHHTLFPSLRFADSTLSFREALDRAVRSVREIHDYAEQKGVCCLYEDQGFYFNGVSHFDAFLGEVGRDVGVVADLGNILFVGETPESFVAHFAPRIRHVHVKDYLRREAGQLPPGEGWYQTRQGGWLRGTVVGHGTVAFPRIISILNSVGYDGFYSLEFDGPEDVRLANSLGLANLRRYNAMASV